MLRYSYSLRKLTLCAFIKHKKLLLMYFSIHCHLLDEIPGAKVLHVRCFFCFAPREENWTVHFLVCVLLLEKFRLHLAHWNKKKRKLSQILQCRRDTERLLKKSQANITFTFACFVLWRQQREVCGSASFLSYRGCKSITDLEASISDLELCVKFNSHHIVVYFSEEPVWALAYEYSTCGVHTYWRHIRVSNVSWDGACALNILPEFCPEYMKNERSLVITQWGILPFMLWGSKLVTQHWRHQQALTHWYFCLVICFCIESWLCFVFFSLV